MMKCKEQCMNIIQLILDYDLDLEVRYICKYFQNFTVPTKKRQLVTDEKLLEPITYGITNKFLSKTNTINELSNQKWNFSYEIYPNKNLKRCLKKLIL